jgi:lysophospholipase L1-like esterase
MALLVALGAVGGELYLRYVSHYEMKAGECRTPLGPLMWTKQQPPGGIWVLDRVKVWNRQFVASREEHFKNWPIPLDTFDNGKATPRYLFKPNQRVVQRGTETVLTTEPLQLQDELLFASNSWGFRGKDFCPDKKAGTLRIVCVGSSTTEGSGNEETTYPRYLEQRLQESFPGCTLEVINAGHHGQDLEDIVEVLRQRVVPLHPDVVLFLLPSFVDLMSYLHMEPETPVASSPGWWLYQHSVLFGLLCDSFGWGPRLYPAVPHSIDLATPKWWITSRSDRVRELITSAREHGIPLVVSSFFTLAHEGLSVSFAKDPNLYKQLYMTKFPFTAGEIALVFRDVNEQTMQVVRACGCPYVDAATAFPREPRYFLPDMIHMTPEGNDALARLFADFLSHNLLQQQGNQIVVRSASTQNEHGQKAPDEGSPGSACPKLEQKGKVP